MSADFVALPDVSRFALTNATLPTALLSKPLSGPMREGLISAHVIIDAERIAAILPALYEQSWSLQGEKVFHFGDTVALANKTSSFAAYVKDQP